MSLSKTRCGVVLLLAAATAGCHHRLPQREPIATPEQFIKRYGILEAPADSTPAQPAADHPRVEAAPRFEPTVAGTYRYSRSIVALRDVFEARARDTPSRPRARKDVQNAIDETFGVSRFGKRFTLRTTETVGPSPAGTRIDLIEFSFGTSGFGQALVGTPERPNGLLLVALHGCLASPDDVMFDTGSYVRPFGRRALEQGYTVIAPYVLSACMWMHNLDWIGAMSGVSAFGYELSKIGQLSEWAARHYRAERTILWGISLGGQYAMLTSALFPDTFDVTVISGAAADYEASYRKTFSDAGLDGNAAKTLGANRQVALSSRVARRDVVAAILPRRIVFELSTTDLSFAPGSAAFIDYVDRAARMQSAQPPEVVLFEGSHGTHPEATLRVLGRITGLRAGTR